MHLACGILVLAMSAAASLVAQLPQWTPVRGWPTESRGGITYDEARQRAVWVGTQIGGFDFKTWETWEWNGTTWQFRNRAGGSETSARPQAYDSFRRRTVLFGCATVGSSTQSWVHEWDGERWLSLLPALAPSPRSDHGLAYDGE